MKWETERQSRLKSQAAGERRQYKCCVRQREKGVKQGERESETTAATNCKKCRALASPKTHPLRGELPPLVACCFLLLYFCAFSSTRRLNLKSSWECAYIPLTSRARTHTHTPTHPHTHIQTECGSHLNANATTGNETDNATYLSLYLRLWFRLWLQAISPLFLLL